MINSNEALLSLLTVLIGGGTACQVSINFRVGLYFGIRLWGAVLNLGMGLILLTSLTALEVLFSREKMPWLIWRERPKWYHLLPGVCGFLYVAAGVFLTEYTGIALFMVLIVSGQLLASAILDHYGVGRVDGPRPLTPMRCLALLAGVGGACLNVSSSLFSTFSPDSVPAFALALSSIATVCVGAAMVVQAQLSRLAAGILPSRLAATWWSFLVSFTCSAALFVPEYLYSDATAKFEDPQTWAFAPWYLWTAGFYSVAYILSSITIPPYTSTQSYFVCLVAGQLLFSTVIEHYGWFGRSPHSTSVLQMLGVVTVLIAAVCMQIPADKCTCGSTRAITAESRYKTTELPLLSERLVGDREPVTLE